MLSPKYIGLVFLLTIPLMGMKCSGAQYKVSGECSTGGNCTVRGEISGTLPLAPKGDLAVMVAAVVGSFDAGSFHLDVSDSTVAVPATGYVTVGLVDSGTGTTQASKVFPWIRSGIAVRYERADSLTWEISAVRSTAHELYHLRNRALARPVAEDDHGRSEEMRASLFESCIEMQEFGTVSSGALDPRRQSDPGVVDSGTDVHSSMQGNLLATLELASLSGNDQRFSSQSEIRQLNSLCESIVD